MKYWEGKVKIIPIIVSLLILPINYKYLFLQNLKLYY